MNKNEKTFIVYFHTNIENNKVYVGITSQTLANRCGKDGKKYLEKKKNGEYVHPKFARAIEKYGWEKFTHYIFAEGVTHEQACLMETSLIALYDSINNGYNVTKGGEGYVGYSPSKELRRKLSLSRKGKRYSPSTEFKKGHTFTSDALKKMSEAKKGKSSWNKGYKGFNAGERNCMKRQEVREKFKGAKNPKARKVNQYDKEGNFMRQWDYIAQITEELSLDTANICACCKGRLRSAYGYKWEYAE